MTSKQQDDGRKTPPGSPELVSILNKNNGTTNTRRRSSGFVYPTLGASGKAAPQLIFYDEESGVLATNGVVPQNGSAAIANSSKAPNQLIKAKEALEHAKSTLEKRDRQLDALRSSLERIQTEATRRASQARFYRESDATLRKELADCESELTKASNQLRSLGEEKLGLVSDLSVKQIEVEFRNDQVASLEQENENYKLALEQHAELVAKLSAELNQSSEKLRDAARAQEADRARISTLEQDRSNLLIHVEALEATIQAQKKAIQAASAAPYIMHNVSEVMVQVALPGAGTAEFLIQLGQDDPKVAAQRFALQHRLSKEATRLLVAFAIAECRSAGATV